MQLIELLKKQRQTIESDWFQSILETYPPDSVKFFGKKKDQFQNPVGHNISRSVTIILDELFNGLNSENLTPAIDGIVRIRSIQDFSPSKAVEFVFKLKGIIRDSLSEHLDKEDIARDLTDFETRIDRLALMVFDNYVGCREQIYEIRVRQARAGGMKLIERLNKKYGAEDPDDIIDQ